MMELIPAGICGLMPGLAIADILNAVFDLRKEGQTREAFRLFGQVLPQIAFALQNLELYLYCEKALLQARGLLTSSHCRSAAFTPDPFTRRYVDELNEQILQSLAAIGA
jgi:4-hydroxy-tetrahydrodipicolinate synthase